MDGPALERSHLDNETLYAVINTVASSLDLDRVLEGIVEIASEATACHACFVYFLEGDRLVLRAASPVYRRLVGQLSLGIDEGLTGWVARNRTPEFIRENALDDPRVKYVPELEEERFQSMVAVPVPARAGHLLGVIVLHTAAPREFEEGVLNFLVHTASLVAGTIENAQLYQETRRRVDALTTLTELSKRAAAVTAVEDLYAAVTAGVRELLGVETVFVYRLDPERGELELASADPPGAAPPSRVRGPALVRLQDEGFRVAPLVVSDEQLGVLCATSSTPRTLTAEEHGLFRAVADQAAVALKKSELIERLTAENLVKDLFEALAQDAADLAEAKATEAGHQLGRPHAVLYARPSPAGPKHGWVAACSALEARVRALSPGALFDVRPDSARALVPVRDGRAEPRLAELQHACAEAAVEHCAVIGIGGPGTGPRDAARALREAQDAARIASALRPDGGALQYDELGAYKYLVHLDLGHAPRDRYWCAVETLRDYDLRRSTHLVDTLEQFLRDRRSVVATARALYIHPNTLRQRIERIEKLSGLEIASADLLSVELAIKLVRLHAAAGG